MPDYTDYNYSDFFEYIQPSPNGVTALTYDSLFEDGSVVSEKIFNGAITTEKLAQSSVTEDILADLAVIAQKLATGSVTATKIANLAVGNAAIANMSADKLTTGTLQASTTVYVGVNSVRIEGQNRRIVVNDGTNDRVLLGYQSGGF